MSSEYRIVCGPIARLTVLNSRIAEVELDLAQAGSRMNPTTRRRRRAELRQLHDECTKIKLTMHAVHEHKVARILKTVQGR